MRSVQRIVDAVQTLEGAGFLVHRPFPTAALGDLDPFLLLDEMGPVELGPGAAKGAPDHPHRGFETVTYLLAGEMEHADSQGNRGRLGPGDVQWMTAGDGVVHAEMPSARFQREGGRMHGFQLWVNLPQRDKRMTPRYQELPASALPTVERDGVWVRVIAGEALGARAAIETRTPITYVHARLEPGATWTQPVRRDDTLFAYVLAGEAEIGSARAHRAQLVLFDAGDAVEIRNPGAAALELLLIGGAPLGEPVARYGPFVMNSEAELHEAFTDYRAGRMGKIPPRRN